MSDNFNFAHTHRRARKSGTTRHDTQTRTARARSKRMFKLVCLCPTKREQHKTHALRACLARFRWSLPAHTIICRCASRRSRPKHAMLPEMMVLLRRRCSALVTLRSADVRVQCRMLPQQLRKCDNCAVFSALL